MKVDISEHDSAIIRAWPDEDEKKMVIQIEDKTGQILAYINLSLEKASDLADWIAIYVAQLRKNAPADEKGLVPTARPLFLC